MAASADVEPSGAEAAAKTLGGKGAGAAGFSKWAPPLVDMSLGTMLYRCGRLVAVYVAAQTLRDVLRRYAFG